jgi:undecaprenyl-diphosphatase
MVLRRLKDVARGSGAALRRLEMRWLFGGLVIVGCAWAFVAIANAVTGTAPSFDLRILEALVERSQPARPRGPAWLAGAARDLTALGSWTVLTLLVAAVTVGLAAAGQRAHALVVLVASMSGLGLSTLLKGVFLRARPDATFHATEVWTTSFPSGHSLNSAVVYLTLAALLAQSQRRRRVALFALATGILLTGLVGVSRVMLGVHWPTDVLAGWAAGFGWACAWWLVADRLRARRRAEGQPA